MYFNTTTRNKKKLEHREIIHRWRSESAMMLAKGKLKTVHASTADDVIFDLLNGLRADADSLMGKYYKGGTLTDGADLYQLAYMYILAMNKRGYWQLFKDEDITVTMASGKEKKVTLAQGTGYHTRNYIYKWGQSNYKKTYIEDYSKEDKDGNDLNCYDVLSNMVEVTRLYDISNYEEMEEYHSTYDIISSHCTARQKLIFHYRMQGYSVSEIANKLGVKPSTISEHLLKVQEIVKKEMPEKVRHFKEGREKKVK